MDSTTVVIITVILGIIVGAPIGAFAYYLFRRAKRRELDMSRLKVGDYYFHREGTKYSPVVVVLESIQFAGDGRMLVSYRMENGWVEVVGADEFLDAFEKLDEEE